MKLCFTHVGLMVVLSLQVAGQASAAALSATVQDADETALDALDKAVPKPPIVKQEPAGAADLRDAVRRIAQRPTDSFALTDAGYAAIKLGDYEAAYNFFTKASALQPADGRIKAGLGIAQVRRENPFEALSLFDEAVRLGANERSFAMDRGLAFDLLGNFERAERDYTLAASWGDNDELTLRHAISLSLSGRRDEADRLLIPMLQKENPEAWRARALMLAARGDSKEAGKIAAGFLPEREVRRMDGYFRNMTRLTPAQQAAAMHFGHFPLGSNIGEDSDSVRALAVATGAKPVPASGDSRLIPAGEPLGAKGAPSKGDKGKKPAAKDKKPVRSSQVLATTSAQQAVDAASRQKITTTAGSQMPPPEAARPPVRIALPALAPAKAVQSPLPAKGPAVGTIGGADLVKIEIPVSTPPTPKIAVADVPVEPRPTQVDPAPVIAVKPPVSEPVVPVVQPPLAVPQPQIDKGPIGPGFDSVDPSKVAVAARPDVSVIETKVPEAAPVETPPAALPPVAAEKSFDLGALVESIEVPEDEKRPSVAPVDLAKIKTLPPKIEIAAAKSDAAAKGAKPVISSPRIFVQIATGSDATGLSFDYRRLAKKYAALFANQDGWTSPWGKSRRLLVGPFADIKTAKKWEADFRKAGGDGFVWQSDKNAEVEKLKGK